jgi:hypothetical protein
MVHSYNHVEVEVRVHAQDITATSVSGLSALIVVTSLAPFDVALTSTRGARENGRMCCEGSRQRRAPIRSRRCSGPGRPSGDTEVSGRRVTSKAPLAHVEGGSGRSEASPTAILHDTHSVEGIFSEVCMQYRA